MTNEEAIRLLTTKRAEPSTDWKMAEVYTMAISALKDRPKGKWITDDTSGSALNDHYYCFNCGKELKLPYTVIKAEQKNGKYLFCDRCGADMRGE